MSLPLFQVFPVVPEFSGIFRNYIHTSPCSNNHFKVIPYLQYHSQHLFQFLHYQYDIHCTFPSHSAVSLASPNSGIFPEPLSRTCTHFLSHSKLSPTFPLIHRPAILTNNLHKYPKHIPIHIPLYFTDFLSQIFLYVLATPFLTTFQLIPVPPAPPEHVSGWPDTSMQIPELFLCFGREQGNNHLFPDTHTKVLYAPLHQVLTLGVS